MEDVKVVSCLNAVSKIVTVEANEEGIKCLIRLGLIDDGDVKAILKKYKAKCTEYISFYDNGGFIG